MSPKSTQSNSKTNISHLQPKFTFDQIKFSVDPATFKRAIKLYESNAIKEFKEQYLMYRAKVQGTHLYAVTVNSENFEYGDCNCYMGKQGYLCKHMIAVAIYAIFRGRPISAQDKEIIETPICSGKLGELSPQKLAEVKKQITNILKLVKPYTGPSRIWFSYQDKLSEAAVRLTALVSKLPVSLQTANLLVNLLKRLDRKLSNGVDDSDGTIGDFIQDTVEVLKQFAKLDPNTIKAFKKLQGISTTFGWEEELVELIRSEK